MNASLEEEQYVNGCRLSSSLLELQPFKVVIAEAKSVSDKDTIPKRKSQNNNLYKNRRINSSSGYDNEPPSQMETSETPLLAANNNQSNRHGTSASCDNIFDSPKLKEKNVSVNNFPVKSSNRSASAEYDPVTQGNSLPKPIMRTTSRERLVSNDSPTGNTPPEQKKIKPKKPNRESLRRSRQDMRASQPNLPNENRASLPPDGGNVVNQETDVGNRTLPGHDYEELPQDVKIVQQRKVSNHNDVSPPQRPPEPGIGFTPIAFDNHPTPAVPERKKNPRQRINPLYAEMHMNPYEHSPPNGEPTHKRPPTRCLRCLVAGVVIAIILSILSIAAILLSILGFLDPLKGIIGNDNFQSNITQQLYEANVKIKDQSNLINILEDEILKLKVTANDTESRIEERIEKTKFNLIDAVKSLNLSALKGPSTADVANCVHKTFGIGSSSTRDEIDSGEYFAEEGYVTTGVTCSASTGYVAYLHTREQDAEWESEENLQPPKTAYICKCHKLQNLSLPVTGDRVECSIHYWQCPVL